MASPERDAEAQSRDIAIVRGDKAIDGVRVDADVIDGSAEQSAILSVLEEGFSVSKRTVRTGLVRVSTRTETREELAELPQERTRVDVTRVPVDRVVVAAPEVRTEGDTTIVPVLEERWVMVKQLVLVEELHIRRRAEHEVTRTPVTLRRQHVEVERLDADAIALQPARIGEG